MASRDIKDLHPDLQKLAQQFLMACNTDPVFTDVGASVFLDCTYRSNEEQGEDYAKGRTQPGKIITNLNSGESAHNVCLADGTPAAMAFDFAIQLADRQLDWSSSDPLWSRAIQIIQQLGLLSGSQWSGLKDYPHAELNNWRHYGQTSPQS